MQLPFLLVSAAYYTSHLLGMVQICLDSKRNEPWLFMPDRKKILIPSAAYITPRMKRCKKKSLLQDDITSSLLKIRTFLPGWRMHPAIFSKSPEAEVSTSPHNPENKMSPICSRSGSTQQVRQADYFCYTSR